MRVCLPPGPVRTRPRARIGRSSVVEGLWSRDAAGGAAVEVEQDQAGHAGIGDIGVLPVEPDIVDVALGVDRRRRDRVGAQQLAARRVEAQDLGAARHHRRVVGRRADIDHPKLPVRPDAQGVQAHEGAGRVVALPPIVPAFVGKRHGLAVDDAGDLDPGLAGQSGESRRKRRPRALSPRH